MLVGDAGTGVASRIAGHQRRGSKSLRREHYKHCPVILTSEYRTSKTCVFCYHELRAAHYRRKKDGKEQLVRVNGALEYTNPDCPSFKIGYTIKPRDSQPAMTIAIAEASALLSPCSQADFTICK
ncbi:hypothetical protein B0O80DRAFT_393722 [Mortierella sp. GBAus27b]|nr:hypothetical protein B0O80DRAFT_393722 [Mortierella sp. GBAus27b]